MREFRPNCLGQWLPWALASIHSAILAAAGAKPPPLDETLRLWTLGALADVAGDSATEGTLADFAALSDENRRDDEPANPRRDYGEPIQKNGVGVPGAGGAPRATSEQRPHDEK